MNHQNIIDTLDGSYWAISERGMRQIQTFISTMDGSDIVQMRQDLNQQDTEAEDKGLYRVEDGIARLSIYGKIHPRANLMTSLSGGTSVSMLHKAVEEIEDRDDVEKMVMMIDSPGGSAKGIAGIASRIRNMETETVAYAEGSMASAAYWIGSAADRVIVSPNAMVGSIGVYAMIVSHDERLKEEGIDVQVIRSADKKALGHNSEPITDEAVEMVQKQVNTLHQNFVEAVALNRNITKEKASAMADGDVEIGSEAADTELADEVMTLDEVMSEEFELDPSSSQTETEQAYAHLSDRYEQVADRLRTALTANQKLRERNSELEEMLGKQREQEIEAVLDKAIKEDKKVAPGKRAELRARLEDDFEGTKATLDLMEKGSAAPSSEINESTPDTAEPATRDEAITALRAEGFKVAMDRHAAQTYETFGYTEGEDLFMADDAVQEAKKRDLI